MNTLSDHEIVRTGPSSSTVKLMAAVGLGAIGLVAVAGFTQMAGADTKPETNTEEPIVTPFDPIQFEQDPDDVHFGPDGEFYCPPCGMG